MTREEYLIRARRAARYGKSEQGGKRSLVGVISVQIIICTLLYSGIASMNKVEPVRNRVEYYLNHTVDYRQLAGDITDGIKAYFTVNKGE